MTTVYTAAIREGISFQDFIWSCARGMGALYHMRDESFSAPVTKPDSKFWTCYEARALPRAQRELKKLRNSSYAQIERFLRRRYVADLKFWEESEKKKTDLRVKYEDMLKQIQAWEPPSPDHAGLKDFMLLQVKGSIEFDCCTRSKPTLHDPADYLKCEIHRLTSDISRYKAELAKRAKLMKPDEWIDKLHASVPCPTGKPKRVKKQETIR